MSLSVSSRRFGVYMRTAAAEQCMWAQFKINYGGHFHGTVEIRNPVPLCDSLRHFTITFEQQWSHMAQRNNLLYINLWLHIYCYTIHVCIRVLLVVVVSWELFDRKRNIECHNTYHLKGVFHWLWNSTEQNTMLLRGKFS